MSKLSPSGTVVYVFEPTLFNRNWLLHHKSLIFVFTPVTLIRLTVVNNIFKYLHFQCEPGFAVWSINYSYRWVHPGNAFVLPQHQYQTTEEKHVVRGEVMYVDWTMIYLLFSMLCFIHKWLENSLQLYSSRKLFGKWKALLLFVLLLFVLLVCCQQGHFCFGFVCV